MTAFAASLVKWSAVGKIFLAGLIGGAGVVVVFGFLLLGLSRARRAGNQGARLLDYAVSAVCALFCVAAVVIGVYALVHKPKSSSSSAKGRAKLALTHQVARHHQRQRA